MLDQNKIKQLQNKSHVRGKLNKQFFSSQQEQLQKKRKQMKSILDQQVEEKRRKKQQQKLEQQKKVHMEDEKIKMYYAQLQEREKKGVNVGNNSRYQPLANSQSRYGNHEYRVMDNGNMVYQMEIKQKSKTHYQLDSGDIPVMPLIQSPDRDKQKQPNNQSIQSGNNSRNSNVFEKDEKYLHRRSAGNILLLELTQDEKKQKKKSKRNPTKKDEKQKQKIKEKSRQGTTVDEEFIPENSRAQKQIKEEFIEVPDYLEEENRQLKKQLKKKQQAISLLMGAVRSNAKLDRFRVQAQKILHNQNQVDSKVQMAQFQSHARKISTKNRSDVNEKQGLLPKLKLHHQSIMHDYMFGSARRAHTLKAKTFK